MNRHQILTGACNGGDCYALGSVEGVNFVVYASGCDIVILASNFQRVVTIPGVLRGNIKVSCVDCSTDTGKIAASFGRKVHIFEPTPSNTDSSHRTPLRSKPSLRKKLDYRWFPTAELTVDCFVRCLSWNTEGSRLLTGGDVIQMWEFVSSNAASVSNQPPGKVSFHLGNVGDEDDPVTQRLMHAIADPDYTAEHHEESDPGSWECIWKIKTANPITHIKYSPDSFVFGSLGKNERLVKIWYEDQKVSHGLMRADSVLSPKKNSIHYTFVYISHPRAVTGFEWRQTSKYMPRGSVANMLVTSCEDNVCRIFVETILPDSGLVDMEQFDPAMSSSPKYHTQRHKKRFLQRLKHIRQAVHKRRKHPKTGADPTMNGHTMNSSSNVHDFHKFAIPHNGVSPVLHFHLACSINPDTDIPLHPIVGKKEDVHCKFKLHWLNNKDLEFTLEAEKLLQDLHQRLIAEEGEVSMGSSSRQGLSDVEDDSPAEEIDIDEETTEVNMKRKGMSSRKRPSDEMQNDDFGSQSSLDSSEEHNGDHNPPEFPLHFLQSGLLGRLDRKIDSLLLDWHCSPDYVFSIHPADGSFLVWLIDHLDEYIPYTFHQAQTSFSSRLPRAVPVPDARSMSSSLLMFCDYNRMDIKTIMKMSEQEGQDVTAKSRHKSLVPTGNSNAKTMLIPNIHMVTKHGNGSLNLWQVSFSDKTKFQNIVSVAHVSRACGHRFRTNSAACHPVLPLLLTTSHHNMPSIETPSEPNGHEGGAHNAPDLDTPDVEQVGPTFCSELILWQVIPVGPLSKTGGITELCRINNSSWSAFTSVAWVPTLLPSTSLGSFSNSPSTLFVASDGNCLRLFQAVIDARSLLMERSSYAEAKMNFTGSSSGSTSTTNELPNIPKTSPNELFNIISLQSSTRPGCVIELDAISDALQDWQNIQLIHVFQEQLISGKSGVDRLESVVDLSGQLTFDENFYLVVVEKAKDGKSILHMWKITIDSKPNAEKTVNGTMENTEDYSTFTDSYNDELSPNGVDYKKRQPPNGAMVQVMTMSVTTSKVCCQTMNLPDDIEVISASVAAGHLSSASIYPACFAPYLVVTACSDGEVRFWCCDMKDTENDPYSVGLCLVTSYEFALEDGNVSDLQPEVNSRREEKRVDFKYNWREWERPISAKDKSSSILIPGQPIAVTCAYSGRVAVAYRSGPIRTQPENPEDKLVNLKVVIYECESTGGSEWVHEDTIELNNIKIPDPKHEIDMYMLQGIESPSTSNIDDLLSNPAAQTAAAYMTRTRSVPSLSTIQSVKKSISEKGNKKGLLQQKCLVQLDWVSSEDGSHLLTVAVGSKVFIYSQVSNEIAKALSAANKRETENKDDKRAAFASSKRLTMNKSMVVEDYQEEIKWMRLKGIELTTADGLPPLPMHLSWVRSGILVVGMDNEMQVFTQWRSATEDNATEVAEGEQTLDKRTLTEANLVTVASSLNLCNNFKSKPNFKSSFSLSNMKHAAGAGGSGDGKKDSWKRSNQNSAASKGSGSLGGGNDSLSNFPILFDHGLFEAARFANPVLPQYHPKLLMELLNFGKTRRVKAILAHLVRCISGADGSSQTMYTEERMTGGSSKQQQNASMRSDADSLGDLGGGGAGGNVNVVEIKSIPPLPLYALIMADKDVTPFYSEITSKTQEKVSQPRDNDYRDLLDTNLALQNDEDDLDAQLLLSSSPENGVGSSRRGRLHSGGKSTAAADPHNFTVSDATILKEYLYKLNLPGLSGNDQFYLAALAEVVASFSQNFSDSSAGSSSKQQGAIDECGLRFLLGMLQYQCLIKTLPPVQRLPLLKEGIRTFYLVWAFHSESTQELLSHIPCVKSEEPVWDELKLYGVGWWLTNMTMLKTLMVKVANTAFKKTKKPMDAALYYLAMRKKAIVKGLFKTIYDTKMEKFFAMDFSGPMNKRVAMKNAYHLLSKSEYKHAAALFFLAGEVEKGINIILEKLDDLQLAIVLCRLYADEPTIPETVQKLFYTKILGLNEHGQNYNARAASTDPFMRSMALWQFNDYESSLQTLLEKNVGPRLPGELDKHQMTPPIFNFYNFLRTHPLIIRQRLASASWKDRSKLVSGFTHQDTLVSDEAATTLDQVTPSERQLFFAASHAHFLNGCPLVAIEVMRKLPDQPVLVEENYERMEYFSSRRRRSMSEINSSSATLRDARLMSIDESWGKDKAAGQTNGPVSAKSSDRAADLFNMGTPAPVTATAVDWSTPISSTVRFKEDDLDLDLELDLGLGDSDDNDEDAIEAEVQTEEANDKLASTEPSSDQSGESSGTDNHKKRHVDVMAQQYKFIACLKVLMEELGNLATGFEVDGGQLRHQLYVWLEKEVEVLKLVCNYSTLEDSSVLEELADESLAEEGNNDTSRRSRAGSTRSNTSYGKATLHEAIIADKHDLQSKVQRMARRKAWLKSHQHLLRTLASYCILQGSGGGGLASVRMELLLLLQELQQERPTQQLLSPLPFPTTLPLLSASITSCRSVVADPIQYLHCSIEDLLQTIIEMPLPPGVSTDFGRVNLIRDLSVALSSCIYQSLCDSDSFSIAVNDASEAGIDGFINPEFSYPSSHLMAGVKRNKARGSTSVDEMVNTLPAKWPGVASLKVLLAREKDEDAPRIHIMLTESLVAVYVSLLICALSMYDTQMLYRLVANKFDSRTWAALFGGGVKTSVKADKDNLNKATMAKNSQDEFSKHRMAFTLKAMSASNRPAQEIKETVHEKFLPPEISMVNYFMSKPFVTDTIIDYDSDDSTMSDNMSDDYDLEDDDDNTTSLAAKPPPNTEHKDPSSYSWCLIRYSVLKSVIENLNSFLPKIGIELSELPNVSPALNAIMKTLEQWEEIFLSRMDMFASSPENYIPGLLMDVTTGQPQSKLQALFSPENSPFLSSQATLPIKRLWFHLVKQPNLRDIFLRYVYKKRKDHDESEVGSMRTSSSDNEQQVRDPMKIIHKEQDIITSFGINQANSNLLALSTQKEIVELDITHLLKPPMWLEDENEYDIEVLGNPVPGPDNPEFLVVQTPQDTPQPMSGSQTPSSYMPSPSHSMASLQTGRGTSVVKSLSSLGVNNPMYSYMILDRSRRLIRPILRRPVLGVRRIGSHPVLPHYLTGGADGAVKLWEWGHHQPITTLRQPGSFPKVTKCLFNAQGNKCCVSDTEGSICLWQVGLGSTYSKPIMSLNCHNKTTSDFQFVGSSSLIATAGQSSEHKNVCLWDTLLPPRSSLIHAFTCHEQGSPALSYASRQHLLISGGRKGEVCIFDLRQRVRKHTFQAHDSPIKTVAIDPDEDYFITGSAEGDIKVWGLKIHQLIFSFQNEHSKSTFFKNVGSTSGVTQLSVGPMNHLYSCGVDGSMKFRQLPERELVVHHWAP